MGQLSNLPSWLSRHPPPLLPIIVLQCQCSPRLLCNLHSSQLMIYDACARSLPGARGGRWSQIATTCGNPIWVASVHCARHTPKPDAAGLGLSYAFAKILTWPFWASTCLYSFSYFLCVSLISHSFLVWGVISHSFPACEFEFAIISCVRVWFRNHFLCVSLILHSFPVNLCMYACLYACMYACMYVCVCIYIHMHACIHTYIHTCIH